MNPLRHLEDDRLQALARGETHPEAEAHLATCDRCAGEVEGYQALFVGLDGLTDPEPDAAFVSDVMARVAARAEAPVRVPRRLVGGLAALLTLALTGVVWLTGGQVATGRILTGISESLVTAAKLRTIVGTLLDALPGAAFGLVVAQVLFLFGLLFLASKVLREPNAVPARIA